MKNRLIVLSCAGALPALLLAGDPPPDIERSAPQRAEEPYRGYRPPEPESKQYKYFSDGVGRAPDETDMRIDLGVGEVGITKDEDGFKPSEYTFKPPTPGLKPEISVPADALPGLVGAPAKGAPDLDQRDLRLKAGVSAELGSAEVKAGTQIDANATVEDYYGADQQTSDNLVVRATEKALAKFDLYYGGAIGKPLGSSGQVNVGVESSWSVRNTMTAILQGPADEGFANEAEEQVNQAEWRQAKIAAEARRLGIDPAGKDTNELIDAIHAKWQSDPSSRRPVFNPDRKLTILELIEPQKVMASGTDRHVVATSEDGDITMDAAFSVVFWNVGALAPGYERAVMSVRTESSNPEYNEDYTVEGSFTGGPNGSFDMDGDTLKLENGAKIVHPEGSTFAVRNPDAFSYWPEAFR